MKFVWRGEYYVAQVSYGYGKVGWEEAMGARSVNAGWSNVDVQQVTSQVAVHCVSVTRL